MNQDQVIAFVNSVIAPGDYVALDEITYAELRRALTASVEQHEAFKREVSDAVEDACGKYGTYKGALSRFIIPKPVDPLVEALDSICIATEEYPATQYAKRLRKALASRGLEIVEIAREDKSAERRGIEKALQCALDNGDGPAWVAHLRYQLLGEN